MLSRLCFCFALALLLTLSNVLVVKAIDDEDTAELLRQMRSTNSTKSPKRQQTIEALENMMKEQKQKIEDHDSGKNKMSGTDYWNMKSGQKQIKNLLFMFKSNMSDEFVLKIIDDEIARAEKNEKENPDEEERKTVTENWRLMKMMLGGDDAEL